VKHSFSVHPREAVRDCGSGVAPVARTFSRDRAELEPLTGVPFRRIPQWNAVLLVTASCTVLVSMEALNSDSGARAMGPA